MSGKVLGLRLRANGPRRLKFGRVDPSVSVTYGTVTPIDEATLKALDANDPLFRHHSGKGTLEVVRGASEKEVEKEAALALVEEEKNGLGVESQAWRTGKKHEATGLSMIDVGDADDKAKESETNARASTSKQRKKLSEFSANEAKAKAEKNAAA